MKTEERERLRRAYYNAHVLQIRRVHDDLMVLRVVPDQQLQPLVAGQYTTLGLAPGSVGPTVSRIRRIFRSKQPRQLRT